MRRPLWVNVVHGLVLLNFLTGMGYAAYVLFVVLAPEGGGGPLWSRAAEVPMELMARRRLYALEFWVAFAGLHTPLKSVSKTELSLQAGPLLAP